MALIYRILVLLFLVFHKLRIKQTARFGNPFGLQTSLVFYGLVLQRTRFLHMYKSTYSDYVADKTDAEAIVCRSATGEDVRLTRADFESDEEFQRWKGWSDADYKQSERRDRAYNDRRLSLAAASRTTGCRSSALRGATLRRSSTRRSAVKPSASGSWPSIRASCWFSSAASIAASASPCSCTSARYATPRQDCWRS